MAPGDSFFAPYARVSGLGYQLGLDRDPEVETRTPRVLHGDPALCEHLEKSNRLSNRSTNFSINWSEWISDWDAAEIGRQYVEEVLLVGVPSGRYAYSLIAHDEKVPEGRDESFVKRNKRTSVHGKIVNTRFPGGGYLQPMYSPRDRMLTGIYFAHIAIERNWSHPLDPERVRNVAGHHVRGAVSDFKRRVVEGAASAPRLPSGEHDPIALLAGLQQLGISDVYATKGLHGKPGIYVRLDDHPRRIRFFGPEFGVLHDYINKQEDPKNEHQRCHQRSHRENCFPGGYLDRSPEHAARIQCCLDTLLANRAEFNRKRYRIDLPTLAFAGLDFDPLAGMGVRFGLVDRQPSKPETGLGRRPVPQTGFNNNRRQPVELNHGHPDAEPTQTEKPTNDERDTDLRGVRTHLGALVAGIVADTTNGVRAVHQSVQLAHDSINRCVQDTERSTAGLSAAARRLDDAGCLLGSAARDFEQTLECPTPDAGLIVNFPASPWEEGDEAGEYLLRVRRPRPPLPVPQIRHNLEMGGL
jgi:hypothetical protein